MFTKDDSCYTTSGRYCSAIEFYLSEHKRRAFCTSQLIEYTLEPNPDAADDKDIPPQRLALVFSTADVVVLGWQLSRLTDKLQENSLAAIRVLSKRYAEVDKGPFIASITITPVAKG
jgi:hypothetical protein